MKSSSGTEERAREVARALVHKICGCFDLEKENETTTALLSFSREREIAAAEEMRERAVLAIQKFYGDMHGVTLIRAIPSLPREGK